MMSALVGWLVGWLAALCGHFAYPSYPILCASVVVQMFTVKPITGVQAKSFKVEDKVYIDPGKLLPMSRFLPQKCVRQGVWCVCCVVSHCLHDLTPACSLAGLLALAGVVQSQVVAVVAVVDVVAVVAVVAEAGVVGVAALVGVGVVAVALVVVAVAEVAMVVAVVDVVVATVVVVEVEEGGGS